jgi:hypothetical protein
LPFPSIKLPNLKKLRQWSHDSLANLSNLTHRNNNVSPKHKPRSPSFPTNGISTISGAIRDQKIDPKKDNFGLYALKCDRSRSLANAKRGILLTLPTKIKTIEQSHEVFQSCENLDATGVMYDGATSSPTSEPEIKPKIEPPPRKKKRPTATRQLIANPKPGKKPIVMQANQNILKSESFEKNESGLYRIVNANEATAKVSIEEPKKKEHVVTMVKPKVQNAVAIKAKPVQQQVAKVKSYEWNKHQRKSSVGNIPKPHFSKRYASVDTGGSFKETDIFHSNKLLDQKKIFDEFDALFDKNKELNLKVADLEPKTPETAFSKLQAIKFSSTSFSNESDSDEKILPRRISSSKNLKRFETISNLDEDVSSKPKIVHEQPKIVTKKILYYDDKSEIQQLIMNQTQSTTIINNHYSATPTVEGKVPIASSCNVDATRSEVDLNGNEDYRRCDNNLKASSNDMTTNNSNSLRIFSNEGIFVFNL